MKYYSIGKLGKTHGLKGEINVRPNTDFDRFTKGSVVYIEYNGEKLPFTIAKSKDFKEGLLVQFVDHADINLIEKYKNSKLFISEEERDELPEGEFYYDELIGKDVYNEDNILRTKCTGIREVPQGIILECNYNDKMSLIPYVDEFIIDVTVDKIIIHEIGGLI